MPNKTDFELKSTHMFHETAGPERSTSWSLERVQGWVSSGSSVLTVLLLAILVLRDSEPRHLASSNQTSAFATTLPPAPNLGHQLASTTRSALQALVTTYDQEHDQQLAAAYQGMTSILWAAAGRGAHRVEFRFDRIPMVGSSACLPRKHACRILSLDPAVKWQWLGSTGTIAGDDCAQRPQASYVVYTSLSGVTSASTPDSNSVAETGRHGPETKAALNLTQSMVDTMFMSTQCGPISPASLDSVSHGGLVPKWYLDCTFLMRLIARLRADGVVLEGAYFWDEGDQQGKYAKDLKELDKQGGDEDFFDKYDLPRLSVVLLQKPDPYVFH